MKKTYTLYRYMASNLKIREKGTGSDLIVHQPYHQTACASPDADGWNPKLLFGGYGFVLAFCLSAGPDVEPTASIGQDFPRSPDSFTLAETAVENIVSTDIGFGPRALAIRKVEVATDKKPADIVVAFA
jgi:hypothetical protein